MIMAINDNNITFGRVLFFIILELGFFVGYIVQTVMAGFE